MKQGHQCMFLSSEKATSDPELSLKKSYGTTRDITRHLSPWLLQFCARWPSCIYPGASATCTECGCSTSAQSWPAVAQLLQHCSSCTGCPLSTASPSRSRRRWCTTFYMMDVRRISSTWLHSTRQTLKDGNSGRRISEQPSWNGHGPNSVNAPSRLVVQHIWNSLPPAVHNIDSHPAFRWALKSHLFQCAFLA